jgi:hypothetical protein
MSAPTPREAATLVRNFDGSSMGLVVDTGRLALLSTLGLALAPARVDELLAAAGLFRTVDAVGLDADLCPGLAEADFEIVTRKKEVPVVLSGQPNTTETEVARALASLRKLTRPEGSSAAS